MSKSKNRLSNVFGLSRPSHFGSSFMEDFFRPFDEIFPLDNFFKGFMSREASWTPHVNVEEHPDKFVISLEAPGISKEDIDVRVLDDILKVIGTKVTTREIKNDETGAVTKESHSERFYRNIPLGPGIDTTNIVAEMKDGLLTVNLPKREETIGRQIDIR